MGALLCSVEALPILPAEAFGNIAEKWDFGLFATVGLHHQVDPAYEDDEANEEDGDIEDEAQYKSYQEDGAEKATQKFEYTQDNRQRAKVKERLCGMEPHILIFALDDEKD